MSPPVGPAGIVECSGDEPSSRQAAQGPRRYRVSAGYSIFATELTFDGASDAFIERRAATAALGYRYSDTISLQAGLGATLGGRFDFGTEHFSFDPGWIASASGTWKAAGTKRGDAFLLVGASISASGAETKDAAGHKDSMYAFDVRASVVAGKTFFDVLSPFAVVRAFGGPLLWRLRGTDMIAGDRYHFQIGAGLLVALPDHFDVFTEIVPLGERAAALGLGYSF